MLVPEAPIHKDRFLSSREDNVGPSGQCLQVDTESVALGEEKPSNRDLWLGVAPAVGAHHSAGSLTRGSGRN